MDRVGASAAKRCHFYVARRVTFLSCADTPRVGCENFNLWKGAFGADLANSLPFRVSALALGLRPVPTIRAIEGPSHLRIRGEGRCGLVGANPGSFVKDFLIASSTKS